MGSVFLDFLLSRIVYREMEGFCLFLAKFLSSWVRNVIFPRNRSCNQKVGEKLVVGKKQALTKEWQDKKPENPDDQTVTKTSQKTNQKNVTPERHEIIEKNYQSESATANRKKRQDISYSLANNGCHITGSKLARCKCLSKAALWSSILLLTKCREQRNTTGKRQSKR